MWRSKQGKIWCNSESLSEKAKALYAVNLKKHDIFEEDGIRYAYKISNKYIYRIKEGTCEKRVTVEKVPLIRAEFC